jgi:hypothetical protein
VSLSASQYRELLQAALPGPSDADTVDPQPQTLFTPRGHRAALDPDATIIRGARGVGKTVWFKALQDERLRLLAADDYQLGRLKAVRSLVGYGTQLDPDTYPGPNTLRRLLDMHVDPYHVWMAVLLRALGVPGMPSAPSWADHAQWVSAHPEEQEAALAAADRQAGDDGIIRLILFDALDRLHTEPEPAYRLIEGILQLALQLRTTTRNLRAKVFVRPDMFEKLRLQFPDASKLRANSAELDWSATNLYGLFFQQLGNANSSHAAQFRESSGTWRKVAGRYVMPPELAGDQDMQQSVFVQLAGSQMGANHRNGRPYVWLPIHLGDSKRRISPRTFLEALRTANAQTMSEFASHPYALHWEAIRSGVQAASRIRVDEVNEDLPWIQIMMKPLAGLQVPVKQGTVIEHWAAADTLAQLSALAEVGDEGKVRTGPEDIHDPAGIVRELIDIGIMSRRDEDRIDLPDVYRIAFGLGRRGGVRRLLS